jgi:class 3 adenylate cyclase
VLENRSDAGGGRILITQRLYAEVEGEVEVEPAGEFALKGFMRPVAAFAVVGLRAGAVRGSFLRRRTPSGAAVAVPGTT